MKKLSIILALICLLKITNAQVKVNQNTANSSINTSSAFMDASSSSIWNASVNQGKGLLFPRVNLVNYTAMSHAGPFNASNNPNYFDGLLVYNTATGIAPIGGDSVFPGYYYYKNTTSTANDGHWISFKGLQGIAGELSAAFDDTQVLTYKTWTSYKINTELGKKVDTSALATVATSGNYNDLTNKPALFDGNYNSLSNKPNIFDGTWTSLTGKPTLFSGTYADLTGKPALWDSTWNTIKSSPTTIAGYGITDAVSIPLIQNGSLIYNAAIGSSNAYIIYLTPAITSYTIGMIINFKANFDNTGSATLNVNNLGAIPIKKSVNKDLSPNEIKNGQMVNVIYDGTNFQTVNYADNTTNTYTENNYEKILGFGSSTTWIVPSGVYQILVEVWSAGGGGGDEGTFVNCFNGGCNSGRGGNGGRGGYNKQLINVNPGESYNIIVGTGGTFNNNSNGGNGGLSSFGNIIIVAGGTGGMRGGQGSCNPSTMGATGAAGVNGTIANYNWASTQSRSYIPSSLFAIPSNSATGGPGRYKSSSCAINQEGGPGENGFIIIHY